jgi:hypothetical protein
MELNFSLKNGDCRRNGENREWHLSISTVLLKADGFSSKKRGSHGRYLDALRNFLEAGKS